jgi:hypothetical protein
VGGEFTHRLRFPDPGLTGITLTSGRITPKNSACTAASFRSATTLQREQYHPAVRLADAAGHYVDALQVAAEDLAGREVVEALDVAAEQIVPGVSDEPAWPTLPAHLLLFAADGTDPVAQLAQPPAAGNSTPPRAGPPSSTGGSTGRIVKKEGGVYELGNREPSALSKVSMLVFKGVGKYGDRYGGSGTNEEQTLLASNPRTSH